MEQVPIPSEEDMIKVQNESRDRTSTRRSIMTNLANVIGVTEDQLRILFKDGKSLDDPSRNQTIKFRKKVNRSKTDLIFSLFNTKPFYGNSIEQIVGMPSLFDYTFAFCVDQNDLIIDADLTQESFGEDTFTFAVTAINNYTINVLNNSNSFHMKSGFCTAELTKRNI